MPSSIIGLIPKGYLIAGLVLLALSVGGYIKYLQSDLENTKLEVTTKDKKIKEKEQTIKEKEQTIKDKDEDIKNIIDAYEATIILREKLATEKAIAQEQKQEVVKITSKLKEAVIKRGEIKEDETKNFSIIEF